MSVSMDLWGVTETGFYRPTIEDIKDAKVALAKEIFGDDFDTGEDTPEGMFFRINAAAENKLCEIAEGIYYSAYPHTAKGVSLDRVCEMANLKREGAGYAEHSIRVYGSQGYIIEAGTEFKNADGVEFYSVMNTPIDQTEAGEEPKYYADVTVQCKESGTVGNINDINSTVEVNTNIDNVSYLSVVAYGTDPESDPELRAKFESVVQGLGTNTRNAIIANVLRVDGVNNAKIIDNNEITDLKIPENDPILTVEAGTYAVVVHSDSTTNEADIAKAIFEKQPLGVPQSGVEKLTVIDNSNTDHVVKFTYIQTNAINIEVACETDGTFASNGVKEIEDAIKSYINSLGIGQDVVYSQLYKYIYSVTGVKDVTEMTINGVNSNIAINDIQIAKIGTIEVTATEG